MRTYHAISKIGDDGMLNIALDARLPRAEYEVVIVVQPREFEVDARAAEALRSHREILESLAGSIQDESFRRHDQEVAETRLEL